MEDAALDGLEAVVEMRDGTVRSYTVAPEDFGLVRAPLEALEGGDAEHNAKIVTGVLRGQAGAARDIVLANAAAALVAAGIAQDFREGIVLATSSIGSGAALAKLEALAG